MLFYIIGEGGYLGESADGSLTWTLNPRDPAVVRLRTSEEAREYALRNAVPDCLVEPSAVMPPVHAGPFSGRR